MSMGIKTAPRIKSVIITLDDGRWCHFTAEDMVSVEEFGGTFGQWKLLQFITSLSPPLDDQAIADIKAVDQ